MLKYRVHPWYVEPTLKNRWSLSAWMTWYRGGALPGDDGDKYAPNGYLFTEIGPTALRDKGIEEMDEDHDRLMKADRGGCPFALL